MKGLVCTLSAVLLLLFSSVTAMAEESELVYVGDAEQGFFRYAFADGAGFDCNSRPGAEDNLMVAFSFDAGLEWVLFRDDTVVPYSNEEILSEGGSYKMLITESQTGRIATFAFGITDYNLPQNVIDLQNGMGSISFGDIVEQPPLRMEFDEAQQLLRYTLPNGAHFSCSAAQGAVVDSPVQLVFGADATVSLWLDDELLNYESGTELTQAGNYRVQLTQLQPRDSEDPNTYVVDLSFRIVAGPINLSLLHAPDGFSIRQASCNGQPLELPDREYLPMYEDGSYTVDFAADTAGLRYTLNFVRDTEAPSLHLSGSGLTGWSTKPVQYSLDRSDTKLTVRYNGRLLPITGWLYDRGNYHLLVEDAAGNSRSYLLRVEPVDYSLPIILIVILTAVAVLMLVTFVVTRRRGLRVI